jgi:hypothetical protein
MCCEELSSETAAANFRGAPRALILRGSVLCGCDLEASVEYSIM